MATIDLMDQFSHLGEGGIQNNGTLDAEVMFQPALRTMRTDFIQVKAGDSIVYKNMSGMSSIWNILSFYTGDAQGFYVSGIAGQTTPQSGVWTAQQDGYVRLFGSFPAGDNISVTMTDLAPDVEDYLAKYNAMNYRFLPNSIPKIVAHIQEYLVDHPIADSTTLQAVIDAAFKSYMDEIQETADTYIAEAVPPAAAAAVDAAAAPALEEISAKTAEAAESAREAALSQQSAEMSEENALTYRNQAQQIKDSISAEVAASVLAAQEQATLAQESAQAADQSADTAEQYVAQARAQAEAAADQAQTASGYASDAQGYMQDASGYAQNASDFADNAAQSAATFSTDPTLTIAGKAADAKATGDQLSDLKSAINRYATSGITDTSVLTWRPAYRVNSVGRISTSEPLYAGLNYTEWLYVQKGSTITAQNGYKFDYSLWDEIPSSSIALSHRLEFKRDITSATLAHNGYLLLSVSDGTTTVTDADQTANNGLVLNLLGTATAMELIAENTAEIEANGIDNILEYSENLINPSTITNKFLNTDGTIIDDSTYRLSDFIRVNGGEKYSIRSTTGIGFYDVTKLFRVKSAISPTNVAKVLTIPKWCKYVRLNTNITNPMAWYFNAGETLVTEPYSLPKLKNVDIGSEEQTSRYNHGKLLANPGNVCTWYSGLQENYVVDNVPLNRDTTYDTVISLFDQFVTQGNGYVTKTDLGESSGLINGEVPHVYKYTFSPKVATSPVKTGVRPKILIDCSMHGFEKNSTYAWYFFLKDLMENYDKNPSLSYIRANVEIQIIPVLNPYGFNNNTYVNGNSVNINRNFDTADWTYVADGSNASGDAPMDQPETQMVAKQIEDNPDALIYINTHTNGQYYTTGYAEANANCFNYIPEDVYETKLLGVFQQLIQTQTLLLPIKNEELNPGNSLIGRIQSFEAGHDIHPGTFIQYSVQKSNVIGMTLEMFNGLNDNSDPPVQVVGLFSGAAKKICSEIAGNMLLEIIAEYSN